MTAVGIVAWKPILSRFVAPLAIALVLFIGLVYFIFPTTTWLEQRTAAVELEADRDRLLGEQAGLRADIARMRTDEEIERIARRDFSLVYPGEEAYALLPAPEAPISLPAAWPFSVLYFRSAG